MDQIKYLTKLTPHKNASIICFGCLNYQDNDLRLDREPLKPDLLQIGRHEKRLVSITR